MKKKKIIIIIVFTISVIIFCINQKMCFLLPDDYSEIKKIGIIDDSLCKNPCDKVIYEGEIVHDKESHGENILNFINSIGYSNTIYYYSAENGNSISSDSIISGLEWMKKNGVKRVNISLSSKNKSDELQDWIENNLDIKVFCSYNNKINTYDYPAMLEGTISSGSNSEVNYKTNDVVYKTSNLIVMMLGSKL